MEYATSSEPVSVLKSKSSQLISRARTTRRPIVITQNGRATAILQDVESFQEQRQTLLLLKFLAQGDAEIKRGKGMSHEQVKTRLREKMRSLQNA
jgi:prevent-host-death family protein